MKRNTTIDENVLDYLIVNSETSKGEVERLSLEDPKVIVLYDILGRWFSKNHIIERIAHFDDLRSNGGGNAISLLTNPDYLNGQLGYMKLIGIRNSLFSVNAIKIDDEIWVFVNNLCRRRYNREKVLTLLKYLQPQEVSEDAIWYTQTDFHTFYPFSLERLPREMVSFWWKQDGKLNAVCYRSTNSDDSFMKILNIRFKKNGNINKEKFLHDVVGHSGDDYAMVFRMEGDKIINGNPPIIEHDLDLEPISIKDPFMFVQSLNEESFMQNDHVVIEKYYALYRLGNKKAEEALRRGGFNLKAKDE
jgi:hypothetical protein